MFVLFVCCNFKIYVRKDLCNVVLESSALIGMLGYPSIRWSSGTYNIIIIIIIITKVKVCRRIQIFQRYMFSISHMKIYIEFRKSKSIVEITIYEL